MALIVGGPKADAIVGNDPSENIIFGDPFTGGFESPFGGIALASGKGGNDLLTGGEDPGSSNLLLGDAWEISGGGRGGNDVLRARASNFTQMAGDSAFMSGDSRGGNDVLIGKDQVSYTDMMGDGHDVMSGNARGGNDVIRGGSHGGEYFLLGESIWMYDFARGGNDALYGGDDSRNSLTGDSSYMFNSSRGGNDLLVAGNDGRNELYGDGLEMGNTAVGGRDVLRGGNAGDQLYGDAFQVDLEAGTSVKCGNDVLVGGRGDDQLSGDFGQIVAIGPGGTVSVGRDMFVFGPGSGVDVINDFQHGFDTIAVRALGFTSFAQLTIVGNRVAFDGTVDGAGDEVTVLALDNAPVMLSASDFSFFGT